MADLEVGKQAISKGIDLGKLQGGLKKESLKTDSQKSIFGTIDKDQNGILDEEELTTFKTSLDKNGNNTISKKEIKKYLKENKLSNINKKEFESALNSYIENTENVSNVKVKNIDNENKKTIEITYKDGTTEIINPDKSSQITQTDSAGSTITKYLDENKTLQKDTVTTQDGTTITTEYSEDGKTPLTSETKTPNGSTSTITYKDGSPSTKQVKLGTTTSTYIYDESGTELLNSKIENEGVPTKEKRTSYTYNEDGTVTENITEYGKTTERLRKGTTIISENINENGKISKRTYYEKGYEEETTDSKGLPTVNVYSLDNKKLAQQKIINGQKYSVLYDGAGNTTGIIVQNGESIPALAKKFGCSEQDIISLNKDILKGKKYFQVGTEIKIPGELEADAPQLQGRKSADEAIAEYAQWAAQESIYKSMGLQNHKGQGSKIIGTYKNGKKESFTVIGESGNGRHLAKSKNGKLVTIAHDGIILKDEYVQLTNIYSNGKKLQGKIKVKNSDGSSTIQTKTYVEIPNTKLPKGRKAVVDSNGKVWVMSHDGVILDNNYVAKSNYSDAIRSNSSTAQKATVDMLTQQLDIAESAFETQMKEDGWAGDLADGISNIWGVFQKDGNQAWRVRKDLARYRENMNELKSAAQEGEPQFKKKFKEIFGVEYNQNAIADYMLNPSSTNYKKAFGTKNNIGERVSRYNESQQTGAAVVKGAATVAAGVAIGVATGGTGLVALGAAAVATTASSVAINASDRLSSDVGLKEGEMGEILENAAWDGAAVLAGGVVGKAAQATIKGVSTAATVTRSAANAVGDVVMGAAQEYAQTGEVTLGGTALNAALGTVGMAAESGVLKRVGQKIKGAIHKDTPGPTPGPTPTPGPNPGPVKSISKPAPSSQITDISGMRKLLAQYNIPINYADNLMKLRNANPKRFNKIVNSGLFDLIRDKKISPSILMNVNGKRFLSKKLLRDIQRLKNQNSIVTVLPRKTNINNISAYVENGNVAELNGKLYVNDNGKPVELRISKEKFDDLFPPYSSVNMEQGSLGDCWLISALDNMMDLPGGRIAIYKMLVQKGDDILVVFPKNKYEAIKFPHGEVIDTSGHQCRAAKGLQMVEQAYAVHRFGRYTSNTSQITDMAQLTNIEMVMSNLRGGWSSDAFSEILGPTAEVKLYGSDFTRLEKMELIKKYANDENVVINLGTLPKANASAESLLSQEYDLYSSHAYAIKGYNEKTGMVYISNPWQAANIIEIPVDELSKYVNNIYTAKINAAQGTMVKVNNDAVSMSQKPYDFAVSESELPSVNDLNINESISTINEFNNYGISSLRPSELNELNAAIDDVLTQVRSGSVADPESAIRSVENLYNKAQLKGGVYNLKNIDKYTFNALRQEIGLPLNYLDARMSRSVGHLSSAQSEVLTDIYNKLGSRIAAGEAPSKELLSDVISQRIQGTNLNKDNIERTLLLKMQDSDVWNARDFRKSSSDLYPEQANSLVKKYRDGFRIKEVKVTPSRMGLNRSEGTFFNKSELDYIEDNLSGGMKETVPEILNEIGKKIQQGEMPSYDLVRATILDIGPKHGVNVRQLEDNVLSCIQQFDEWKPISKYLETPKRILDRKDPTTMSVNTKVFRETKGISGEYKPEVKTVSHNFEGINSENLRSDEIKSITRIMNPKRAQTVVNIIDNLEWEIKHGATPSKNLLGKVINDELFKNPNPAIDPDKFQIEIRNLLNDSAIFPDWSGITTFWYKSDMASNEIINQYPEFITNFLHKRAIDN